MSIGHCRNFIFKIGSLVVLQECERDGSSNGVQESLRKRLQPLIEIQVTDYAYKCLLFRDFWVSLLVGGHS